MHIFIPVETAAGETRVCMLPPSVKRLVELGAKVVIEAGLGAGLGIEDKDYQEAGAEVASDGQSALGQAAMVLRLRPPPREQVALLQSGCIHISYLDPFDATDLVEMLAAGGISAISMELIPRTTLAQKMDALSSQANLGGYVAVTLAAERLDKVFPMMMTPAGTLQPARVFVIGVGVAGLQAIATAKRLGARVEAFDTRPVVEEQVKSLGARFVKVDLGETGQTKDGYAKALSEEQLAKQRAALAKVCGQADVVITTAQVFGRKAPLIVTEEMVKGMKPGAVVVDMAVESGGNVAGSRPGEEVLVEGVRILGLTNLPGRVPEHASQMYSANLENLITHFWDKEAKTFNLDRDDEIIAGCLLTHGGEICNEMVRQKLKG